MSLLEERTTGTHRADLLRTMLLIRRFEERCAELYSATRIRGFLHLYVGEEAVATGVMSTLHPQDSVVSTYREHGHALARGVAPATVMAEMFGRTTGCSRGRGGSMHLFDAGTRFLGGNAVVAGGIPLAVGLALADRMRASTGPGGDRVTACFFGDGAVAEGEFHESMNLAALWRLPVLFVCENNRYAMGTAIAKEHAQTDLALRASSYGMTAWPVDGMDVLAVEDAATRAVEEVRGGGAPVFLELRTYRFRAHSMYDPDRYRPKDEIAAWRDHDPIPALEERMRREGQLDDDALARLEAGVTELLDAAVEAAEQGPLEPVEELTRFVTSPGGVGRGAGMSTTRSRPRAVTATTTTYREALREAIREAMRADERVFLMGEDVGSYGGCYAVSLGLLEEFGPERIRDTPLSESAFVGAGIGAALNGMRPIVEVMTVNFSLLALDQILNNAASLLHMSGGQFNVPLVIRMTTGAGRQLAAQHSHSLEGWYAHIPGLRVLAPATVTDARGMLEPALADPDPVVIFEHGSLYNASGPLPDGPVELEGAAVRRPGDDVTIIAYGGCVPKALAAADLLAAEDRSAEVVDLRSLRPLDDATVVASVRRTHRVVVVDEGCRTGSLSAEVSARITEQAFFALDAPVERVCTLEVPLPYPRHLEEAALPQPATIAAAARRTWD